MAAQLDTRDSTIVNITDLPSIDIALQTLARRSMFWRPVYLAQSAWLEHIPFAFWLTEAHRPRVIVELGVHYGVSYFAFCQAVERLGLDTRCFGVDTFKGDEHAGIYDEQVFEQVRAHNELQYSGFSRLVRSTFDDALKHFADHSIDLLHIDGLHTIEAVRHDFESWLPKLSKRAIVIMHDTNVRERNFGVFKLFESLRQQYPHFEFVHGHGLGVLGVGKEQNELMQMLFHASNNEHSRQSVQEVFSRLGQACSSALAASKQQEKATLLSKSVEKQKKQIDDTTRSLEKAKSDINSLNKALVGAKETIHSQKQQQVMEREHFAERAKLFDELRTELKEEKARLLTQLEALSAELQLKNLELSTLSHERNESQRKIDAAMAQVAARDHSITTLNEKLAACLAFEQKQNEIVTALSTEKKALVERVAEQERIIAELRQAVDDERSDFIHASEQLHAREAELAQTHARFLQASSELETLREEGARQVSEISTLKQTLAARDETLETLNETLTAYANEVIDLRKNAESKTIEQQSLQSRVTHLQSQNEEMAHENQALIAERRQQAAELDAHLKKLAELTKKLDEKTKETKTQEKRLEDRFKEITELTKMVDERDLKLRTKEKELAVQLQRANKLEGELKAKMEALKISDKQFVEIKTQKEAALAQLQTDAKKLTSELQAKTDALKTSEKQLADTKAQATKVQTQLQAEQQKLKTELQVQAKRLEDRFKELATLTKLLEDRDKELAAEKQRIAQLTAPQMLSRSSPEIALQDTLKNAKKEKLSAKAQMLLIEKSGLFDTSWYLTQYPDVAEAKMNPIQHYVLHGASEGRMPGPHFDTKRYIKDFPELLTSQLNPLVHYIKHNVGGSHAKRNGVNQESRA